MSKLKSIFGTCHAVFMEEDLIRSAMEYQPTPDDIFLCTYPKSGTNWTHTLLSSILRKGDPLQFRVGAIDTVLEVFGSEAIKEIPNPRVIPTHMKQTDVPFVKHAKYVYVVRNPKDACFSYYRHIKSAPQIGMVVNSFDDFVNDFISGEVPFGSYFEHFVSWYKRKDEPNVLFLSFEDMKRDIRGNVLKTAKFLGEEYADALKEEWVLESIVERCSLKAMYKELSDSIKKIEDDFEEAYRSTYAKKALSMLLDSCEINTTAEGRKRLFDPACLVRKGEVGASWNKFTDEQSWKIEQKFLEVTKELDLSGLWYNVPWMTVLSERNQY